MPVANLNGAQIHYTDSGTGSEAIVFSHGLLFNGTMFEAQIAHFQERYRCIAFDHRGQGQSGVTQGGYDIDTLTEDAAALIQHLGLAPCHFVGLSMGGFVGLRLAAHKPDLIKSLTVLDSSAEAEPAVNGPKYRLLNLIARWIGLGVVVGQVLPIMFGKTYLNDPERAEDKRKWANVITGNDRIGITRAVSGVINRKDSSDILGKINKPVGIGVGDEDIATLPEKSERMHKAIAGSRLVYFKGAGHSSSIETPSQVIEIIEDTVSRTS